MSMSEIVNSIERESFERCVKPSEENKYLDWMPQYQQEPMQLIEHRCSCGRFLGKFSGQAEIKCPKCGKVNMIGVEK